MSLIDENDTETNKISIKWEHNKDYKGKVLKYEISYAILKECKNKNKQKSKSKKKSKKKKKKKKRKNSSDSEIFPNFYKFP